MKLIWTIASMTDRQSIVRHINADSPRAASEMDDRFVEKAELLAEWPELGRPGRLLGTREFLAHRSYLLIYTAMRDELHILRVLHTSRQWPPV